MDFVLMAGLGALCGAVAGLWVGAVRGRPGLGLALGLLGAIPVAVLSAAVGAETALLLIVRGDIETLATQLSALKAMTAGAPALAGLLLGWLCPAAPPAAPAAPQPEDWRARIEAEEKYRAEVRAKMAAPPEAQHPTLPKPAPPAGRREPPVTGRRWPE